MGSVKITSVEQLDWLISMGGGVIDPDIASPEAQEALDWYARGTIAMQQGNVQEAIAVFQTTVSRWPRFVAPRVNLAHCLNAIGRPVDALKELDIAHDLAPHDPDIHMSKASTYNNHGRFQDALAELFLAQEDYGHPHNMEVTYWIGVTYQQLGQMAESRKWLQQALESVDVQERLSPFEQKFPEERYRAHIAMAEVCDALGDWPAVAANLRVCVSMNPKNKDMKRILKERERMASAQDGSKAGFLKRIFG